MTNLVQNNTFSSGLATNWTTADGLTGTTGNFFGSPALQVTGPQFAGLLSQSIDLTSVAEGATIHIAYRIAAAQDGSTSTANFWPFLNSVGNSIGGGESVGGFTAALINSANWNTELPTVGTYYLKEFTWTVTNPAKTAGNIFLIFQIGNGGFDTEPLFTLTDVYFSTTPFCYNEGTQILCINSVGEEEYRAIENIRVGHLVKTYKHGAKAVTHIGKGEMINSRTNPIYCMYKLPKTGDMIDDLIVLGGHSILVDKYDSEEQEKDTVSTMGRVGKIEDKYLLLAKSSPLFTKMPEGEKHTYYHLVLDNTGNEFVHYGIWANGVLSESCSEAVFKAHNLTPLE